jgi:hypothetical protein
MDKARALEDGRMQNNKVKGVVMRLTGLETPIAAVIVGAIIGFVPNYLMDVRRERSLLRNRWDSALFDLCSDFASIARGLQELCLRRPDNMSDARLPSLPSCREAPAPQ